MNQYRIRFRSITCTAEGVDEYQALHSTGLFRDNIELVDTYKNFNDPQRPVWLYRVFMADAKGLELVVIERI